MFICRCYLVTQLAMGTWYSQLSFKSRIVVYIPGKVEPVGQTAKVRIALLQNFPFLPPMFPSSLDTDFFWLKTLPSSAILMPSRTS